MNCQEVQFQLSGYLEKSLDTIRMKSIETHLSSCPFCRAELHGLSDCVGLVAGLPAVEPPVGFAQRVMAHAREIEIELSAWQRLLAACRTTMPIQAAATVLIAVLAVLLYQREPPVGEAGFSEIASQAAPAATETRRAQDQNVFAEQDDAALEERAPAAPERSRRSDGGRADVAREKPTAQSPPAAAERATSKENAAVAERPKPQERPLENQVAAPRRPAIKAQEISTGSEARRPSADSLGIGAAVGALSRTPFRGTPYSAQRALSPLSEPSPDFEFVVRRRPRERLEIKEELSADLAARGVAAERAAGTAAREAALTPQAPVVEIRWFTVLPEHYEHFRKDLAAEANIESEKTGAAKESSFLFQSPRELLIKVTILQPER